jgi:hypothetical protein
METLVINTETSNITKIKEFLDSIQVSFTVKKKAEKPYKPEFVAKIMKSREQHKQGLGTTMTIEELNNLWK